MTDHPGAYHVKWPENSSTWWWDYYEGGKKDDGNESDNIEDSDDEDEQPLGHDTVIMDEFRHNISFGRMLSLIDRGPFKIKYHGGMTTMNSHTIVITTNIEPENWYPKKDKEGFSMLRRRFNDFCTIYDFTLPTLAHWQQGYTGETEKQLHEIVCVERTQLVPRTVGPTNLNFRFTNTVTIPAGNGDSTGNGFLDFNMGDDAT